MSLKAQLVDDGTVVPVPTDGSRNDDLANGNTWATLSPGSIKTSASIFFSHLACRFTLATHPAF